MYIKTIIIDGFKSYAKRTEINGFDPSFNAITGLNGSGKSNILDAICFVLGISNLSQVRASNLQDLVYKSGQAGVTKATVSIVFDNLDKSNSPIGYENFDELTITRQIVVGGKNKYLINGITATNTRVADLFKSVQLNVNNPHFLIMQGRITKVLNMKPPEILSLLEEAASTKNYEDKRDTVLKTIQKKEGKLKDIQSVLKEDIEPKLSKLRQEVENYKKYQQVIRELEYLNKFIVADQYTGLRKIVDNFDGEMTSALQQQSEESDKIEEYDEFKRTKEIEIEKLTESRNNEHQPNLEAMNHQHSEMKKTEALIKNAVKRANDLLKSSQNELKQMDEKLKKEKTSSNEYRKQIAKIQSQYDGMNEAIDNAKKELESATKNVKDVNMGIYAVSESDEKKASLSEILRLANRAEADLRTELSNLKIKIRHFESEKSDFEKRIHGMSKGGDVESQQKEHSKLSKQKNGLENEISKMGYSEEKYVSLQDEMMKLKREKRDLENQKERIIMENNYLDFQYKKPNSKQFDDSHIYGIVARLVKLKNPECNTALEIIGGGRLYNVVVRDDEVGATLFNQDCLYRRTTLLPLNRMQPYIIPEHKFLAAQSAFGSDRVWHPMKLLEFNESMRPAIGHVFGSCLIARDLDTAKQIAFDSRYGGVRCVTLEGDMFDPEGTLVGGARPQSRNVLQNANLLNDTISRLIALERKNCDIINEIQQLESCRNKVEQLQKRLLEITSQINDLEVRMMRNDYLNTQHQLDTINTELNQLKEDVVSKTKALEIAITKAKEAKENFDNSKNVQEKAKKCAQDRLEKAKSQYTEIEEQFKNIQTRYDDLTVKLQTSEDFETNLLKEIDDKNDALKQNEINLLEEKQKLAEQERNLKEIERDLKDVNNQINQLNKSINEMRDAIKEAMQEKNEAIIRLDNIKHTIECLQNNRKDADKKLEKMHQKYAWIEEEKRFFGQPGSMYDFEARSRRDIDTRIAQLEKDKLALSRKVDLRGMNLLGPKEEEYQRLMGRYKKVQEDKSNLQSVILDLDKMRDQWIKKAHIQVDTDFNKIFSTLLPGSQARLVPPEGKNLMEGLEFRIALGNVWKESLSELSGGQRSLVALSLVLALLRFKPAPLYILDEVDAALDISHTQNIGTIIRDQFQNSQFVVVSLKDGMFNNANVLFKTKFVDGVSTVSRHVNVQQIGMKNSAINNQRKPMAVRN